MKRLFPEKSERRMKISPNSLLGFCIKIKNNLFLDFNFKKRYRFVLHPFPDQKILYIEVPKAGCSSVKYALRNFKEGGSSETDRREVHSLFGYTIVHAKSLKQMIASSYPGWIVFTVVRNPYDRFLSLYYDDNKKNWETPFDEYLNNFVKSKWIFDNHGIAQASLIGDDLSAFDFVGRTENMPELFTFLSKSFQQRIISTHKNKSSPSNKITLNSEQKEKIFKLYKKDFEVLGYER